MPVDCPFPIHFTTDISYFCSEKIKTVFEHLIREVSCVSLHTTPFLLWLLYGKLSSGIYLGLVYRVSDIRFGGKVRETYVSYFKSRDYIRGCRARNRRSRFWRWGEPGRLYDAILLLTSYHHHLSFTKLCFVLLLLDVLKFLLQASEFLCLSLVHAWDLIAF